MSLYHHMVDVWQPQNLVKVFPLATTSVTRKRIWLKQWLWPQFISPHWLLRLRGGLLVHASFLSFVGNKTCFCVVMDEIFHLQHYIKYDIQCLIVFSVVISLSCSTLIFYTLTISVRHKCVATSPTLTSLILSFFFISLLTQISNM